MSKLSDVISAAEKSTSVTDDVRESLRALKSRTEGKLQQLQTELDTMLKSSRAADGLTVPITKRAGTYAEARAITKQTSDVPQKVREAIEKMFSDHSATGTGIVTGMAKIATQALDTLLSAGEGAEKEALAYMVVPDRPAIIRYDFACWNQNVAAQAVREHCKSALACVIYRSEVDVGKLSFSDFLTLYAPVLNAAFGSDQAKLQEMIGEAKKTYDQFKQSCHMDGAGGNAEPLDMDSAMQIVASHVKPGVVLSAPEKAAVGSF